MNNMLKVVLGAGVLLLSSQAFALPLLTGQIVLDGTARYYDDGDASNGTIDGIDVVSVDAGGNVVSGTEWGYAGKVTVDFGTSGTFATLFPYNTPGIMNDINFANPTVSPLWTVGDISFSLTEYTFGPIASGNQLFGRGMLTDISGTYADTTGTFTMNTSATSTKFSFDATTAPEPAGIALFGMGLLVMGLTSAARRRNNI